MFTYELEGIEADLAERVQKDVKLRASIQKAGGTGVKLVPAPKGWSNPYTGERADSAYRIEVLGVAKDASVNTEGSCAYAFLEGDWKLRPFVQT